MVHQTIDSDGDYKYNDVSTTLGPVNDDARGTIDDWWQIHVSAFLIIVDDALLSCYLCNWRNARYFKILFH